MVDTFGAPLFLWLFWLLPLAAWGLYRRKKITVYHSDIKQLKNAVKQNYAWLDWALIAIQIFILGLLIVGLARPQAKIGQKDIFNKGVDIVICLDASGSMAAEDLQDNRLESAKKIIGGFIQKRPNDRIGLVVFGVAAITRAPLTYDKNMLINAVQKVKLGETGDGTAIGQALVTGLNRLRNSEAQSKVLILVTDGENNSGSIGPLEAAKLADDMGVKIYTVGIGTAEGSPMIVYDPRYGKQVARMPDGTPVLTRLNVGELVKIADAAKGQFFQAKNTAELAGIFGMIDKLERTKLKSDLNYQYLERFQLFILLGLIVLGVYWYMVSFIFPEVPDLKNAFAGMINYSKALRRRRQWLLIWAVVFILIALLRPQWGLKPQKIERRGLDIVFALDVSRSMGAQDILPSRLDKSLQEMTLIMNQIKGDRVGIVTFAGSATPVCPLTLDYPAAQLFLQTLKNYQEPVPGTNLENAFRTAEQMYDYKAKQDRLFLIFTDGESHEGNLERIKSEAAAKGIIVVPIAIGTAGGQPVPEYDQNGNLQGYKKDKQGNIVISHLDLAALRNIAGFGPYIIDTGSANLGNLLNDFQGFKRSKLKDYRYAAREERYQIFLLVGFLLLIGYCFYTERKDTLS